MSERYLLTATLDGVTETAYVEGDDTNVPPRAVPLLVHDGAAPYEVADADASMEAIRVVLDRAVDSRIWARGAIVLTHEKSGRVVREMAAKGDA